MSVIQNKLIQKAVIVFLVLCAIGFALFPLLWALISSLKPESELIQAQLIIKHITLRHYNDLFSLTDFAKFFTNSIIVGIIATFLCTIVATFAAYSFTRFTYKWNVERLSLLVYIVPPVLLVIPIYLIFQRLHLNNSYLGLALSHSTFMLPFATLLLVAYFRGIPVELDEAALIDGANRIKVITNIILPLALPGMVATGIIVFAFSWNDYLYAFTLISVPELRTIPLGIAQFSQSQYMEWGMLMAAAVITTLPMLLFFLFIQRKLLAGFIFAP
ncbi:carbohydrate ABC transporter permease, partial [bacterium]|nr:carbohydrate ABC transporter permease [bacterium]